MKRISLLIVSALACLAQSAPPIVQVVNMSSKAPIRAVLPMQGLPAFVEVFVYGGDDSAYQATLSYHGWDGKPYTVTQLSLATAASGSATLIAIYVDAATIDSVTVQPLKFTGVVLQAAQ